MAVQVGDTKSQYIGDRLRYSMSWVDAMTPEDPAYPASAKDTIASSTWALATNSPVTTVTLTNPGFDKTLGVTWVSIEDNGIVDGEIIWVDNTIETAGLTAHTGLDEATSTQKRTRRYKIKFVACE